MLYLPEDFSELVHPDTSAYCLCFNSKAAQDVIKPGLLAGLLRDKGEAAAICVFVDGSMCFMPRGYFAEFAAHADCATIYQPGFEWTSDGLCVVANLANIKSLEGNIDKDAYTLVSFGRGEKLHRGQWDVPIAAVRDQFAVGGFDFDVYAGVARSNKQLRNFAKSVAGAAISSAEAIPAHVQ